MNPRLPPSQLFALRPPQDPLLSGKLAQTSIQRLHRLTKGNDGEPLGDTKGWVEKLKERLQESRETGASWFEATDVPRREWTLLRLYTLHLGTAGADEWLCNFDEAVAESVLGTDGRRWNPARRRDVTNLFYVQYDRIDCLPHLSKMLRMAWTGGGGHPTHPAEKNPAEEDTAEQVWARYAEDIFTTAGPDRVAAHRRDDETTDELADRFFVPKTSVFRDHLYNAVLLRRLHQIPLFEDDIDLFWEIEGSKARGFRDGRLLGGRAVQIMIDRVIEEGGGQWEETWSRQLVPLACHPRVLNPGERQRWWGWASPQQRDIALRGLTGLNIREFIRLLEGSLIGTGNGHQFPGRRDFLLKMFDANLILDAKLVVNQAVFHGLDAETKRSLHPSQRRGTAKAISFICLRCSNDIFLIEGTHSFSLRGFLAESRFPIRNYWDNPPMLYDGSLFRADEYLCDIYQRHTPGWEKSFLNKLRQDLHIEWPETLSQP